MDAINQTGSPSSRQGMLSLTIKEVNTLYQAYISFAKNGGLFIPTHRNYHIGDEVFMLLTLMNEADKIPVAGRVIWITPPDAHGGRVAGIGVQFNEVNGSTTPRAKIETYLAGLLKSERPTQTM